MVNKSCQVCPGGDTSTVFYDAKLKSGQHGYLCQSCFDTEARYGNRYVLISKRCFILEETAVKPAGPTKAQKLTDDLLTQFGV